MSLKIVSTKFVNNFILHKYFIFLIFDKIVVPWLYNVVIYSQIKLFLMEMKLGKLRKKYYLGISYNNNNCSHSLLVTGPETVVSVTVLMMILVRMGLAS